MPILCNAFLADTLNASTCHEAAYFPKTCDEKRYMARLSIFHKYEKIILNNFIKYKSILSFIMTKTDNRFAWIFNTVVC